MRLLVLSHPCVTPINQEFFAAVEQVAGWDVSIIVPSTWKNDYAAVVRPTRWRGFNGTLIEIPTILSGNIPLHFYRSTFVGLIETIHPDVIYAHHEPYAAATIQLCMANRLTRRCPIGFYSAQNIQKRYPLPFHLGEQFVFEQSAFAFPVSRSVEEVLRAKGYRAEATVLPLGIDPAIYRPHPDAPSLAAQLRGGTEDLLIGYLGRLTEEKGLRTLLHALAELRAVAWRLVVVGSGDYEDEFVALARRLGLESRVSLIGFVPHPEAPRYLSAFDLLVLPSETRPNWKEQFGRVVVEALACGTPVVGSDSGEIPIVINATGGGVVFREGDPSDLARAILELARNPEERRRMVTAGQAYVGSHLENGPIALQFVETVSRAVAGPSDPREDRPTRLLPVP
jgi:glycosyltransferase involved in cell wall biosynthesis